MRAFLFAAVVLLFSAPVFAEEVYSYSGEAQRARDILLLCDSGAEAGDRLAFYTRFEQVLRAGRGDGAAWRLTALTDLSDPDALEDGEDGRRFVHWPVSDRGAPVDAGGNPIYYGVPESWEAAANDGERWRWVLARMTETGEEGRARADWLFGEFLFSQFGVQTIAGPGAGGVDPAAESGLFAVRTLREDETIARLGGGVKRFVMPDEFNHIFVLRRVAESGDAGLRGRALALLASVFENRRQYPKAVDAWRRLLRDGAGAGDPSLVKAAELAVQRIVGRNGVLESAAGAGAAAGGRSVLSYLFRNGDRVDFVARRLDEKKLLADIREKLRSGDREFYDSYLYRRPETLGRFVFEKGGEEYLGGVAAEWSLDLAPLPDHFSRRVEVELPLEAAGCYLVEAAMRGGNTSRLVLWIADTALVRKDAGGRQMFFVADAATGEPVAGAALDFLGLEQPLDSTGRVRTQRVHEFAERTDEDGLLFLPADRMNNIEWLITATDEGGRLAYLGFDHVWSAEAPPDGGGRESAFLLTDRPVYRPGQVVHFKAWLAKASYAAKPGDSFAGRAAQVTIHNPRGEVVQDARLVADAYGGVDGSFVPEEGAPLGQYYIALRAGSVAGGIGFQVEEYKKPEFEVSLDAPAEALALGDSVQLKVRAAYYYGAPVVDAKVSYRILRSAHVNRWVPPWRWDWLYGAGAWLPPSGDVLAGGIVPPPWMPFRPELVAEGEGALDADGVFRFTLDTAPAKEFFGHQDHAYQINFDVVDKSRRSISGAARVIAARKPFSISVWTDRGHYRAGDEIRADIKAMLPLGAGVAAKGEARLIRVGDGGAKTEDGGIRLPVETDADGTAALRFRAGDGGRYRLVVRLEDADGNIVEGEAGLAVRGAGGGGDVRFPALELVPDKREYAPGEALRLAVNSEKRDAFVLFFPRAERGGGGLPQALRLENGTREIDLAVGRGDLPNFFCEAITVFGGEVHSETREIFVPPADKALSVEVTSDKDEYLPGEKAVFRIAIADADGKPVVGQCAVSLYDASVEYVSGGGNVGDIRSVFWSWKRFYYSGMISSLSRRPFSIARDGDEFWQPLGIFDGGGGSINAGGLLRAQPEAMMATAAGGMVMEAAADMAAPMAAPMPAPAQGTAKAYAGGLAGGAEMAEAAVRSEFADTAFWTGALETDADGAASFAVDMPENLTGWKTRVWVMGAEARVGEGGREVVTRKNIIVRPQAPRFLTQKDRVVLSANLHNYLPRAKAARAELVLEGGLLQAADGTALVKELELPANGEARVDWVVDALRPGTATVVMRLLTDEESDAAEISIPVIVHGARRVENFSAVLRGEDRVSIPFTVPEERLADQSRLQFSFSPGIAMQLLEALPYLIEYPYGCTEQTLNRFLPALTVRKFLDVTGVSLADAKAMLARSAANEDEQSVAWRAHWGDDRARIGRLPVFDDGELDEIVSAGIERLAGMQNADGGWGWFSGAGERSWAHTTAVVAYGLKAAAGAGAALPAGLLDRGLGWLAEYQAERIAAFEKEPEKEKSDGLDAFVHLVLSGSARADSRMRGFLFRDRAALPPAGRVMLGLALAEEGRTEELAAVLGELSELVEVNAAAGTARLRVPDRDWWLWQNDAVETQAWYLKLLAKVDPKSELASGVAKYLLQNRRNGAYWRSTRDTAYAVGALAEYAAASGEAAPDMTVKLYLDGAPVMERRLTAATLLRENRFVLDGVAVEAGAHELVIERAGEGALYCGGSLSVFSLEDPIAAAGGAELSARRKFYRLVSADQSLDMQGADGGAVRGSARKYTRVEMPSAGGVLATGDLVEVELELSAANDYEYIVFEDMKAAGLEAVELRSGYGGGSAGAYVEYRDEKVALFLHRLAAGVHTLSYRFRAEVPGAFSALPVFGGGMYATDLFCNSEEMKIRVVEEGAFE